MVYHLLNGLLPQLGVGPSSSTAALSADCHDTGAGLSKLFGHIKFSVPLVECTRLALEEFKVLCDELAAEGSDDVCVHVCVVVQCTSHVHCTGALCVLVRCTRVLHGIYSTCFHIGI